jgi:hypothetical protein
MKYFDLIALFLLTIYLFYTIGIAFCEKNRNHIKDNMFEFIHPASL